MPSEIEKFQNDLLESVRQMKRGEAVRTTQVKLIPLYTNPTIAALN